MVSHVYACTVAEEFEPSAEQAIPTPVHIPRFDNSEEVKDFFNLLNVAELDAILNPSSYKMGALLPKDRVQIDGPCTQAVKNPFTVVLVQISNPLHV